MLEEFFRTFFDNLLDLRIRVFSVIYWDRSIFNYRFIYLFILELFCDQNLRWRNFFEPFLIIY